MVGRVRPDSFGSRPLPHCMRVKSRPKVVNGLYSPGVCPGTKTSSNGPSPNCAYMRMAMSSELIVPSPTTFASHVSTSPKSSDDASCEAVSVVNVHAHLRDTHTRAMQPLEHRSTGHGDASIACSGPGAHSSGVGQE